MIRQFILLVSSTYPSYKDITKKMTTACTHCHNYSIIHQQLAVLRSQISQKNQRIRELEDFIHRISQVAFVPTNATLTGSLREGSQVFNNTEHQFENIGKIGNKVASRNYMEMPDNYFTEVSFKNCCGEQEYQKEEESESNYSKYYQRDEACLRTTNSNYQNKKQRTIFQQKTKTNKIRDFSTLKMKSKESWKNVVHQDEYYEIQDQQSFKTISSLQRQEQIKQTKENNKYLQRITHRYNFDDIPGKNDDESTVAQTYTAINE